MIKLSWKSRWKCLDSPVFTHQGQSGESPRKIPDWQAGLTAATSIIIFWYNRLCSHRAGSSLLLEVPPIRLLKGTAGTSPPHCVLSPFVYLLKSFVFVLFSLPFCLQNLRSLFFGPPPFDLSPYTFAQEAPFPSQMALLQCILLIQEVLKRKENNSQPWEVPPPLPTKPSLPQWPNCCEKGDGPGCSHLWLHIKGRFRNLQIWEWLVDWT